MSPSGRYDTVKRLEPDQALNKGRRALLLAAKRSFVIAVQDMRPLRDAAPASDPEDGIGLGLAG